MSSSGFDNISSDALNQYLARQREGTFMLLDVRQPDEYAQEHIPGAKLIPLGELETRLGELPTDRSLVFYCHSGARSQAAAFLTSEMEITTAPLYNLVGGIMAWSGKTLPGFPKLDLFAADATPSQRLMRAMDLEKGAWRFYRFMFERFSTEPFADVLAQLSKAEEAHARVVYGFWKTTQPDPEPFQTLYGQLEGNILEGGQPLAQILADVDKWDGGPCLNLMELALNIEYTAYDLYKNLAEADDQEKARDAFLTIAQAEKGHLRSLVKAVALCT